MKKKLFDASIIQIDPANCGSSVGWVIRTTYGGSLYAEVELTDCGRKIKWDFSLGTPQERSDSLRKIGLAIAALSRFRDRIPEAQRWKRKQRRLRKKK